jgi:tRNA-specific 2-thiouridylase
MVENSTKGIVVVAMSGGVDSSVAACILRDEGYQVIGITMKTYSFDEVGGNVGNETSCCGLDAFNDARRVAVQLGIPHYVVDFTGRFESEVVANFADEYLKGRTPNPCIICNKKIKWGLLLEKALSLGADYLATGHYARIEPPEGGAGPGTGGRYRLLRARYGAKDQSYALWGLSQEALSRTLFPLGDLSKEQVRAMAKKNGLSTADKEESYEICFVADNDYGRFIGEYAADRAAGIPSGDIFHEGKKVGTHDGYPYYTIGQRNGIGAHGRKMYVTSIDAGTNSLTIGGPDDLLRGSLLADSINFVSVPAFDEGMKVSAQIRYRDVPGRAEVFGAGEGRIRVVFEAPKRAITPGQSVVLYDGDLLLGGGLIHEVGK